MDFAHRTIPENEKADLREAALAGRLAVPVLVDLRHDVPEIFRKGKLESGGLDRRHVGAGARRFARGRRDRRGGLGWRLPRGLLRGRALGLGHRHLFHWLRRRLHWRRLFLRRRGWNRLASQPLLGGRRRRRHQLDRVRRRGWSAGPDLAEEETRRSRVDHDRPDHAHRGPWWASAVGADVHRDSSSAATSPTFWIPAFRMIASTRTTCP